MLLAPARDWPLDDHVLRFVVRVLPELRAAESRSSWFTELDEGRVEAVGDVVGLLAPAVPVPVVGRVAAPVPAVRSPVAPARSPVGVGRFPLPSTGFHPPDPLPCSQPPPSVLR